MKIIISFVAGFLLLFSFQTGYAQTPEKIYGKNHVLKSNDYYLEQMELWKKEVDKDLKNADAWFNYYKSNRNAYIVGEELDSLHSKGINRFERLKKIVLDMEKHVPNSFEFNYVTWANGNNNLELFPYLEKAHQLAPERTEPLMNLVYYYELKGNAALKEKYALQYHNSGEFSPGLLNYGYNMLVGLEKNAIVFTEGDKDTDAILLLQNGKGMRKDVQLLNVNLLLVKEYRDRILNELEVPLLDFDPFMNDNNYEKYKTSIIEKITKNKKNRPVYVAVTVSESYTRYIQTDLYLTGLSYQYSNKEMDYMPILKKNYEDLFAIDYLKVYFPKDISIGMLRRFNQNYYPSLATLHAYCIAEGDKLNAKYYKEIALKIAEDEGSYEEYDRYFKER